MRFRGFSLGIIVVTVLFLLTVTAQCQEQAKPGQTRQIDQAQSLAKKVFEDGEKLKGLFKPTHFEEMAKFLDSLHAVLIAPDYEIIYGKDSAAFWAKIWDAEATLVIEPMNFHFSGDLGVKKTKEGTMDSAAFIIQKVRVVLKGEKGEIVHNQSGLLLMPGKHRNDCQWY